MKKTMALFLTIVFAFNFVGCSKANQREPSESKQIKEVQLTVDNFENYFNLNGYSDNYNESYHRDFMGFDNYTCSCTMHISVEKMYDFEIKEPIQLKFDILLDNWDIISGTESENYQTYAYISVPVTGNINKTYPCSTETYFTMASSLPKPHLEEVTGTIYIYE